MKSFVSRGLCFSRCLPSTRFDDFFGRLHALLFGVFHVMLVILAMVALLVLAWREIPKPSKKTDEPKSISFRLRRSNMDELPKERPRLFCADGGVEVGV